MRQTSANAFFASLGIHGVALTLLVFFTYYVAKRQSEASDKIFELVQGPPTAPDELVAAALGNSLTPVKNPAPPQEETAPQVAPEPKVVETVKTEPEPVAPPVPKAKTPEPTPKKPAETKPKPDTSIAREMKQAQRMSYKDYLKKHPTPKPVATAGGAPKQGKPSPRVDTEGIAQGVRGGSTTNKRGGGGGKALSREEMSAFDTYKALLRNALIDAYEPAPGVSDNLLVEVAFDITASGSILNPRVIKSSGSKEYDDSVIAAFKRIRSLGPTPDRKSDTWSLKVRLSDLTG